MTNHTVTVKSVVYLCISLNVGVDGCVQGGFLLRYLNLCGNKCQDNK